MKNRLVVSYVTKNETNRWLQCSLASTSAFADDIFVYDDKSDDDTVDLAFEYTKNICVRWEDETSFMEDESKFRSNAWAKMEEMMELQDGDWILSLDADEVFVGNIRNWIELVAKINKPKYNSINVPIPEVWQLDPAQCRMDGFWNTCSAPRLVRYKKDWTFLNKEMGCGSVPTYALKNSFKNTVQGRIYHLGYALEEDRKAKAARYAAKKNHGHNQKHIDSILQKPTLGNPVEHMPELWRGVK